MGSSGRRVGRLLVTVCSFQVEGMAAQIAGAAVSYCAPGRYSMTGRREITLAALAPGITLPYHPCQSRAGPLISLGGLPCRDAP